MDVRFARMAALAGPVALLLLPPPAQAQTPPPMLSQSYVRSLDDVLNLEQSDVARLERKLAANPDDVTTRTKLMAYHQRADRAGRPEDRARRAQLAIWLIEHHPDSEVLHAPVSHFTRGELSTAGYRRAVRLWDAAGKTKPRDAAVQWNAASFFQDLDPELYLDYLEATAAADPNHPYALRPLAYLYALSILGGGPLASRAHAGLEASRNVWVLGNAAYMLHVQYNQSVERGQPAPRAAELAERYFLKAKVIDPNLDRRAILPELQRRSDRPARPQPVAAKVRRLAVEAFPNLPPAIAGVLRARNCKVPQPSPDGAPRNAIPGEFFAKGEAGWAVLCSVTGSTALLAFRNAGDTNPATVTTNEDGVYLQELGGGRLAYSREITAVRRDFIMRHYRAYGGPEPPAIDHQGIDDAFLEKASVTWYFHNGKWLRLQGAD